MARPRKTDPRERDWPRIREIKGRIGFSTFQVDSLRDLHPRVRKNFKTLDDAKLYAEHLRRLRNNNGLAALGLTPAQMDDARRALELIRDGGIATLVDAARLALAHHRPSGGDIDLAELRERFIQAKERKGRRSRTIGELENRTSVFLASFRSEESDGRGGMRDVYPRAKEITPAMVQAWFDARGFTSATSQTAKNYRRVLNNLFEFAVKQRYVSANPVTGTEIPEGEGSLPKILTIEQCRALLETARTRFPEFIPYLTLALFCGLRPESELERLSWTDVQLDRGRVHIPRGKTKVALARNVTISACAMEWLMLCPSRQGMILPENFRCRWDRLRWFAGFRTGHRPNAEEQALTAPGGPFADRVPVEWPQDGMRHTFATNHLAFHRNAPLTSAEMGHLRPQTIVFYSGLEPQTDPAAFWNLRPPAANEAAAGNVVEMSAAV